MRHAVRVEAALHIIGPAEQAMERLVVLTGE
jgi:hypothetical protein